MQMQLIERRYQDAQRETDRHQYTALVTMEQVNQRDVRIGIQVIENIGNGIVHHMIDHTWDDTVRAVVKPAQQHPDEEGMRHLCRIHVDSTEKDG